MHSSREMSNLGRSKTLNNSRISITKLFQLQSSLPPIAWTTFKELVTKMVGLSWNSLALIRAKMIALAFTFLLEAHDPLTADPA